MNKLDDIYGYICLNDEEYPFVYKDYVIQLITGGVYYDIKDLSPYINNGCIEGKNNNGHKLIFIDCKFVDNFLSAASWISTRGVIVLEHGRDDTADNLFNKINFYSPVFAEFYPPIANYKTDYDKFDGKAIVETVPFDESKKSYLIDDFELSFAFSNVEHYLQSVLLSSTSFCSFEYNQNQDVESLKSAYLKIFNFMSFMTFSKSIYFEDIRIRKAAEGKTVDIGRVYLNQRECEYSPKKHLMISLRDLPDDCFGNLFKKVTKPNDMSRHYYIPTQPRDVNTIDHGKWVTTAACFEGLFDEFFKGYKPKESPKFVEAKTKMLDAANDCIKLLSGKKLKGYAKDLKNQIERYDGRLEQKFKYAYGYCSEAIDTSVKLVLSRNGVNSDLDLAKKYAKTRNEMAHGTFERIDNESCAIFLIIHIMIYAIILKQSGIEDDVVKQLIQKVFR